MEYRVEFKLAINNHEAISLKMNHLTAAEIPDAQHRIEAMLGQYAEKPTEPEPKPEPKLCVPCQPTQPECGACGEERVKEATAELDRQMDKVAEIAKATPAAELPDTNVGNMEPAPVALYTAPAAGTKGLLYLHCAACDHSFVAFLKDPAETYLCKCGAKIDLDPCKLARFEYDCPDCKKYTYGYTNDETAGFEISCVCRKRISLEWRNKTKSYIQKGE